MRKITTKVKNKKQRNRRKKKIHPALTFSAANIKIKTAMLYYNGNTLFVWVLDTTSFFLRMCNLVTVHRASITISVTLRDRIL